jgi:hypothetical protein
VIFEDLADDVSVAIPKPLRAILTVYGPILTLFHVVGVADADDWYEGILPARFECFQHNISAKPLTPTFLMQCEPTWDVCVDGSHTELPGPAPVPAEYLSPLPAGEPANQGGP